MYVSIEQSTKLTGKSRSTISRAIKSGKLSRTEKGIDVAELRRVYGEFVATDTVNTDQKNDAVNEREVFLMRQIDMLNDQLISQKKEHLDREARLMALLEHKMDTPAKEAAQENTAGSRLFSRLFK